MDKERVLAASGLQCINNLAIRNSHRTLPKHFPSTLQDAILSPSRYGQGQGRLQGHVPRRQTYRQDYVLQPEYLWYVYIDPFPTAPS